MMWYILRPHYWILDRKVRSLHWSIVGGVIFLLGMGGQWLVEKFLNNKLDLLASEQAITLIASTLPTGIFIFILFALLGIGDVIQQLYMASDLELLMVAPISNLSIFLVKLLQCGRASIFPALSFGGILIVLGWAVEAEFVYYLLVVLLLFAAMMITTGFTMILIISMVRWLPVQKARSWMPLAIFIVTIVLVIGHQSASQWMQNSSDIVEYLAGALINIKQLALVVVCFCMLSVGTCVAAYILFSKSFREGWNRFREVPSQRPSVFKLAWKFAFDFPWAKNRATLFRSILIKELLVLKRNPRGLIALFQPFILIVMILAPYASSGRNIDMLKPLIFWIMMMLLGFNLVMLPLGIPLMSIVEEGRNLALFRSAPIHASEMLKGKFWAAWFPTQMTLLLAYATTAALLGFSVWQIGQFVGLAIYGLMCVTFVTMAIAVLKVDFFRDNVRTRISGLSSCLIMGINALLILMIFFSMTWIMLQIYPDSQVAVVIRALVEIDAFQHITSHWIWLGLLLIVIQCMLWFSGKKLWDAAVRRLNGIQVC